ncbi:hypothetical protein KL86CLO1_12608 [uncultured Eubacteriales bacterium]|uniref:Uncharacterized protein n=1 Tax=uncultured Eubacteriales bacterium TaxID=172733 RepID=A0A212KBY8_9FIRM|nr:hypothetical protein KL86CLO1_12608 [uncultured Eubacteriales bacterium]
MAGAKRAGPDLFAHGLDREKHELKRRHYVTWDNEQKLYRVKERIDTNSL